MTCTHIRADGTRCESSIGLQGDPPLCPHHDPERSEAMREIRAAGAKGMAAARKLAGARVVPLDATPGQLETMDDAVRWASWLTQAVATGLVDSRTGDTATRALREFRAGLEVADLEKRVRALEEGAPSAFLDLSDEELVERAEFHAKRVVAAREEVGD